MDGGLMPCLPPTDRAGHRDLLACACTSCPCTRAAHNGGRLEPRPVGPFGCRCLEGAAWPHGRMAAWPHGRMAACPHGRRPRKPSGLRLPPPGFAAQADLLLPTAAVAGGAGRV
eukprot:1528279-Prymnesium_polylepis.1